MISGTISLPPPFLCVYSRKNNASCKQTMGARLTPLKRNASPGHVSWAWSISKFVICPGRFRAKFIRFRRDEDAHA